MSVGMRRKLNYKNAAGDRLWAIGFFDATIEPNPMAPDKLKLSVFGERPLAGYGYGVV